MLVVQVQMDSRLPYPMHYVDICISIINIKMNVDKLITM